MTDAVAELLAALNEAPPFAALAVLTGHLKDMLAAEGVSLLLADYGERTLERLDEGRPMRSAESLPVDASVAGRAFRRQEALVFLDEQGDRHHVYTPVSIRADRLGVLDVVLTTAPGDEEMDRLGHVATALAYVIAASRPFTDVFERVRRYQRLELAAEIQWGLLPALAYEGDVVSLAGILEPAYEFGGDNFDYSVEEGSVTVSVTDAMGHGLRAAVVGSLAVNALRNARRSGLDLAGQAEAANDALVSQFDGDQFVSALLMRVDLATGRVEVVDAGHPAAFRVRNGHVCGVEFEADYPLGMFAETRHTIRDWQMERGDRLVIVSDGIMEAKPDGGDQFGEDGVRDVIVGTTSLAPTEFVRLVIEAVVKHRDGALRDDATVVCVDWKA